MIGRVGENGIFPGRMPGTLKTYLVKKLKGD